MTRVSILPADHMMVAAPRAAGWLFRQVLARVQAFQSLNRLSERQLRDIGLTQDDVVAIRTLPLATDVSTRLAIAASAQAGNW